MPYLTVCYNGYPSFNYERSFDRAIEKAVGKESTGSGCGFGGRDVSFTFRSWRDAHAAVARIRRMAKKRRRRISCSLEPLARWPR